MAILIGGQKGGTGKSTVATNLAVMAAIAGKDVMLVDCDKQGSSMGFIERRQSTGLKCPSVSAQYGKGVGRSITEFTSKYEIVVVDSGGHDSIELRAAMASPSVSLMLCPIRSGYFDVETLVNLNGVVEQAQVYNTALTANCLINQASTNTQVTVDDEAAEFMSDLSCMGVCETRLRQRSAYASAVFEGLCAIEYELVKLSPSQRKATSEIRALYAEVMGEPWRSGQDLTRSVIKAAIATEEEGKND